MGFQGKHLVANACEPKKAKKGQHLAKRWDAAAVAAAAAVLRPWLTQTDQS